MNTASVSLSHPQRRQPELTWRDTDKIKKEEILEYPIFTKFEREDLEAATEEQLKEWSLRLRNEINSRRTNTVEEKTPRGRKRMQED